MNSRSDDTTLLSLHNLLAPQTIGFNVVFDGSRLKLERPNVRANSKAATSLEHFWSGTRSWGSAGGALNGARPATLRTRVELRTESDGRDSALVSYMFLGALLMA